MFSYLKQRFVLGVAQAAKRGNPLAQGLVARETRAFLKTLPAPSPIVPGPYEIPDLEKPLPEPNGDLLGCEYERVALDTRPVSPAQLVGRRVEGVETTLGSYGPGGYGFFGLLLGGDEWFVIPVFGAAEWLALDGRILDAGPAGWIVEGNDTALLERLLAATIVGADLGKHSLTLRFDNKARLEIAESPKRRAPIAGTGQPRAFLDTDNLAASVFFSPSAEIYA